MEQLWCVSWADFLALRIISSAVEHSGFNNFLCSTADCIIKWCVQLYGVFINYKITLSMCLTLRSKRGRYRPWRDVGDWLAGWLLGRHEGGMWPNGVS